MGGRGARALFGGVVRLVPFSGVQAIDVEVPSTPLQAHFIEEELDHAGARHRVVLPLDARPIMRASDDASLSQTTSDAQVVTAIDRHYHPLTGKVVEPAQILTLDAATVFRHFAGRWVPLPYFRFTGRDARQRPLVDNGPSNWARACIAHNRVEATNSVRITVAFDTNLETTPRLDDSPYLAPVIDDAAFGSTFICAETVDDVAPLLAEPWFEAWLVRTFAPPQNTRGFANPLVAYYLTLLRVLSACGAMPEVRFIDTIHKRFPVRVTALDLVVDIGENETSALLVDVTPNTVDTTSSANFAEVLRLRDLSEPDTIYDGPFPTAAEFTQAPFGDRAGSWESGRPDAFNWPSLVRVGEEARRLSMRGNGADGVTGLSSLRAFLLDGATNQGLWRESTDNAETGSQGPMVSGELLGLLTEGGAVLGTPEAGADARPAIRPKFSRASLMSLFVAELALHALTQANAATREGRGAHENEMRELRQVVVLAPSSMTAEEQEALLARFENGLLLAWRGLGWDGRSDAGIPRRPSAVLSLGGDIGTQIAFLHDEVATKYQGRFEDLVRVYRGGATSATDDTTLHLASVDFGARATSLLIADYGAASDAEGASTWLPSVRVSDRFPAGAETVQQAVIVSVILPAIASELTRRGLEPAANFIDAITGRSETSLLVDDPYFTRRMNRKALWPAARGLLALHEKGARSLAHGNRSVDLITLIALGGGRIDDVASAFDRAALQSGARGFALADVGVELRRGEIDDIVRTELGPCIAAIANTVAGHSSDLLLVGGEAARLPSLGTAILAALPLPAGRIVDLTTHVNRTASDAIGAIGPATAAAMLPALATALDQRDLLAATGLGGVRHPALPAPANAPERRAIAGPPSPAAVPESAEPSQPPASRRAGKRGKSDRAP